MRPFPFALFFFFVGSLAVAQTTSISLTEWSWAGDLRYRLAQTREDIDDNRPIHQLRARLGFKGKVQENVGVQFRLATGTSAISTNQTLGDSKEPGMPRRNFGLDLAFADWNLGAPGRLWLGRTANPFYSPGGAQTLLDSDLAFEGFAYKWEDANEARTVFVNVGTFMISENYMSGPPPLEDLVDTGLVGFQLGASAPTSSGVWTAHVGTHQYLNIQDKGVAVVDAGAKTDPYSNPFDRVKGNTVYPNDPLAPLDSRRYFFQNAYVLYEAGVEWKFSLGAVEATLFLEQAKNPGAPDQNEAREGGLSLKWGRVSFIWSKNEKQADAVVGAFTDSDFNGGGTDNRGEKIAVVYKLSANSSFAFTGYRGQRGVDTVERGYAASQADFNVAF